MTAKKVNFLKSERVRLKTRRVFMKKGTCSRTFYYILNREFGHPADPEETAADPLAGGICQQGYQCGMIWGAALALGEEAFRRGGNADRATRMAIRSTRHLLRSFVRRAGSDNCSDIIGCDFKKRFSLVRAFITGKFINCFILAGRWAPEALQSATEGLSLPSEDPSGPAVSCASEVVRRLGGSDREILTVAGLAGGLGLSGNGCGALAALIWKHALERVRKGKWQYTLSDPEMEKIITRFYEVTDYEMECREITGRNFNSVREHTDFIREGGCRRLIDTLGNLTPS